MRHERYCIEVDVNENCNLPWLEKWKNVSMRLQHFLQTTLGKPAVASSCVGNRLISRTFSSIMILDVKAVAQLDVKVQTNKQSLILTISLKT
jgi:hypothetical protein